MGKVDMAVKALGELLPRVEKLGEVGIQEEQEGI